jgi:hypothetical protein
MENTIISPLKVMSVLPWIRKQEVALLLSNYFTTKKLRLCCHGYVNKRWLYCSVSAALKWLKNNVKQLTVA